VGSVAAAAAAAVDCHNMHSHCELGITVCSWTILLVAPPVAYVRTVQEVFQQPFLVYGQQVLLTSKV
jgi:hypothetical protein